MGATEILPRDRLLVAIVVLCSASVVGAFLLHTYDLLSMPFTISFVSLPALLLTLGLAVWAGRVGRAWFLRRLYVGAMAGLLATLVYDALRAIVYVSTPSSFDPFRAHRNFGALMLSTKPETLAALAGGWVYHFWNGISFAVMYSMVAGGARYYWAVAWAVCLETATILVYPTAFGIDRSNVWFIAVSLVGHLAYGSTLGILTREWLRNGGRGPIWQLARPDLMRGLA